MSQEHLDRLSAVDASFLLQEGANTHMHIGCVATFAGPPPTYEDLLAHVRSRLHLVPRYRQKVRNPPLRTGRPLWVDDPNFNLAYHVRQTGLPRPGSEDQLLRLVGRVFSQRLDRTKPLWEMWMVEGYEGGRAGAAGGRFALIVKTHHCLVDGVSGVDLLTVLFDLDAVPARAQPPRDEWTAHPEPSPAELVAAGARGLADLGGELVGRAAGALTHPRRTLEGVRDIVQGVAEVAWAGLNPPAATVLTVPPGPHRRFAVVPCRLEDFKSVKNAFGGTVNDVVLAVVAGGLAEFLRSRGVRTEGMRLRAIVPVSVRTTEQHGALGNQLTQVLCPLPVYIDDPVARLQAVRRTMDGLKESKQALGAEAIIGMERFAPPTILAQASRLHFARGMYTLLVSNVPGPQFPLYVLGREMEASYPVGFLGGKRSVAVAVMSYNGGMNFGLMGDFDALPDLELIGGGIQSSLADLLALAERTRVGDVPVG
jgi:diacylglycerol O-acyltransferase / wax synthase